jgi:Flp pilus assembly protein TadB
LILNHEIRASRFIIENAPVLAIKFATQIKRAEFMAELYKNTSGLMLLLYDSTSVKMLERQQAIEVE